MLCTEVIKTSSQAQKKEKNPHKTQQTFTAYLLYDFDGLWMDGKVDRYWTTATIYYGTALLITVSPLFVFLAKKIAKHDLAHWTLPNVDTTPVLPRS